MSDLKRPKSSEFRRLRDKRQISLTEVARRSDLSRHTVHRFENGKMVRFDSAVRVAKALEVSVNEIVHSEVSHSGDSRKGYATVIRVHPAFGPKTNPYKDIEKLGEILPRFRTIATEVIENEFDGRVVSEISGEIVGVFESSHISLEGAVSAVKSAIRIRRRIGENLALTPDETKWLLAPRIGIHTHAAYFDAAKEGSQRSITYTCAGHVAHELQREADPNQIIVSETTYGLVKQLWTFEYLFKDQVTEITLPNRADGESPTSVRPWHLVSEQQPMSVELVGRQFELQQLRSLLKEYQENRKSVPVNIRGNYGIGKTRLLKEFKRVLSSEHNAPHLLWCNCRQIYRPMQFYVVLEMLRHFLGLHGVDREKVRAKLEIALESHGLEWQDEFELLSPILCGGEFKLRTDNKRAISLLVDLVFGIATNRDVILIVEDLQWCDHSSGRVFELIFEQLKHHKITSEILAIVSHRTPPQTDWAIPEYLSGANTLELRPLKDDDCRRLLNKLATQRCATLSSEEKSRIVTAAKGTARLIEVNLEKVVNGTDTEIVENSSSITPSESTHQYWVEHVNEVLKNDPIALRVLQIAAIFGYEFELRVLSHVWKRSSPSSSEATLEKALDRLVDRRFLHQDQSGVTYHFESHAFAGTVGSLDGQEKKALYGHIASAYERFDVTIHPAIVARFYELAGRKYEERAAEKWYEAGMFTLRLSAQAAHQEAGRYFRSALKLLPQSVTGRRKHSRLQVLTGLQQALMRESYVSDELDSLVTESRMLVGKVRDSELEFRVHRAAWSVAQNRCQHIEALGCVEALRKIAERKALAATPYFLVEAHHAGSVTHFSRGEFRRAISCQKTTLNSLRKSPTVREEYLEFSDHDPGPCCAIMQACTHWFLGEYDLADECKEEATRLLPAKPHVPSQVVVECYSALMELLSERYELAQQHARNAEQLALNFDLSHWHAMAVILGGAISSRLGRSESDLRAAINKMQDGRRIWTATGACGLMTMWRAFVADALIRISEIGNARLSGADADLLIEELDEAYVLTAKPHYERFYLSVIQQLYSKFELSRGDTTKAMQWREWAEHTAKEQRN